MAFLVGTDEAGYGPNLGPLAISATAWEVADGTSARDLYSRLAQVIASAAQPAAENGGGRVAVADSKSLYQSGKGLRLLERGLLTALAALGHRLTTWREAFHVLLGGPPSALATSPWYAGYDEPLPLDADPAELDGLAQPFADGLAAAGVRLVQVRSRVVFEEEFNRRVEQLGSKGTLLSRDTLELVAGLASGMDRGPIVVYCDKHGGRNHYRDLLAEAFSPSFVEVCGEGRERSVYRFGPPDRRVEVRFEARGESYLPTALASMASKYLRELAMRAVNAFWRRHVEGLRPTAGYPEDTRRFKADIAAAQRRLGIPDRLLWRCK